MSAILGVMFVVSLASVALAVFLAIVFVLEVIYSAWDNRDD